MLLLSKKICLREIRISDVSRGYCRWMNDPGVNRFLESRFEKWSLKKLKDYVRGVKKDPNHLFLAVISRKDNRHIGNIKLGPIDRRHNLADIGILIGEKSYWGKGIATEAIKLLTGYAFDNLSLHKLTAGAYAVNIGSIKAFKKAGFRVEGTRKKHCLYNGRYVDEILMGMLRE